MDNLESIAAGFSLPTGTPSEDAATTSGAPTDDELKAIAAGFSDASPEVSAPVSSAPHAASGPQPSHHHTPTRFQQAGTPSPASEPELSWGQVGEGALKNAIPSATGAVGSMWNAVTHPGQTLSAIGQLGLGVLSQAEGALGAQQNPVQKAKTEALAKALESHYATTYGSVKGFKKALATDPASIALDASTFLGGTGAAADAAGLAKTAGVLGKAASAVDPISNALRIASLPVKALSNPVTREIQQVTTGVPTSLLKVAKAAGQTDDPVMREAFLRHYSGQGSAGEVLQTAQNALSAVKQQASDAYLANKAQLVQAPVPFTHTYQALDDADAALAKGAPAGYQKAKAALGEARSYVDSVAQNPNPMARNIEQADALKKQLWDLQEGTSNSVATQYLKQVYQGVRSDIAALDPAYDALMENYQRGLNEITDISKTAGLGRNPAASASLAKMLRSLKAKSGEDVLSTLAQHEPTLPYMLAGSALHPWTPGGARNVLEAAIGIPWAVALHNPLPLVAQAAAQSPKLAGAIGYAAGAAGRMGARAAASPIGRGVYYAGRIGEGAPLPGVADNTSAPASPQDIDAATRMVMAEAANQSDEGKLAALYTAINRARASGKPLSDVIAQPNAYEGVTNGNAARFNKDSSIYQKIRDEIVIPALSGQLDDPTGGMTHFLNKALQLQEGRKIPDWATGEGLKIGDHTFYSASGGRIERASGGKVDDRIDTLVNRLMSRAKLAKRQVNDSTKPLLKSDDNLIAKALEIAQAHI